MNTPSLRLRIQLISIFTLLFSVSGCKPIILPTIAPTETGTAALTPTKAVFSTQTPTSSPTLTITVTPLPTETLTPSRVPTLIRTSTPSPTPAWTPLPTLSRIDALNLTLNLMKNNAGCKLPCWWGFIPGETSWDVAKHFLAQIDPEIGRGPSSREVINGVLVVFTNYGVTYELPGKNSVGDTDYNLKNGTIYLIHVYDEGTESAYRLPQILSAYGKPSQVYLSTESASLEFYLPFRLVLYYQSGILAYYETDADIIGDQIRGCPQQVGPALWLWKPEEALTVEVIQPLGLDPPNPLRLLEEVTDQTVDSFYQTFKNEGNNTCIRTPRDLWK